MDDLINTMKIFPPYELTWGDIDAELDAKFNCENRNFSKGHVAYYALYKIGIVPEPIQKNTSYGWNTNESFRDYVEPPSPYTIRDERYTSYIEKDGIPVYKVNGNEHEYDYFDGWYYDGITIEIIYNKNVFNKKLLEKGCPLYVVHAAKNHSLEEFIKNTKSPEHLLWVYELLFCEEARIDTCMPLVHALTLCAGASNDDAVAMHLALNAFVSARLKERPTYFAGNFAQQTTNEHVCDQKRIPDLMSKLRSILFNNLKKKKWTTMTI